MALRECKWCDELANMEDCKDCGEWEVVCEYCGYCHKYDGHHF